MSASKFRIEVFAIVGAALLVIAYISSSRSDAPAPVVIIDRWWGVDYAKVDCRIPAYEPPGGEPAEEACEQSKTASYNDFESEFKTDFASNTDCAGITLLSFGYPQDPNSQPPDTSKPYWGFSINYTDGQRRQFWQMLPPEGSKLPMMQATGTQSQIAAQVCTIIRGKGGSVDQ